MYAQLKHAMSFLPVMLRIGFVVFRAPVAAAA